MSSSAGLLWFVGILLSTPTVVQPESERVALNADSASYLEARTIPVSSKLGSFVRTAQGRVFAQTRYTLKASVDDVAASRHTFNVPLARLTLFGKAFDPRTSYFARLQSSTLGNSDNAYMLDWFVKRELSKHLYVQTGRFWLPYSRQFIVHPGHMLFADSSIADIVFCLPRGIGAAMGGKYGRLGYDLAVVNSMPPADGRAQQNWGGMLSTVGRLELDVLDSYGFKESLPGEKATRPQLSLGIAAAYGAAAESSALQNTVLGDRVLHITFDGGYRDADFTSQFAMYYRRNHRTRHRLAGVGRDWGYYLQAGYYLVSDRLELTARISGAKVQSRPEVSSTNRNIGSGSTTECTVGLNGYLWGHGLKIQADYSRVVARDGAPGDGHRVRVQTQLLF